MLKKLVSALALTGLAFGSGLCFNPYNHDYGVNTKNFDGYLGDYSKTLTLHNGKMQIGKSAWVKLIKYTVNGNKALILMRFKGKDFGSDYYVVYTECIDGKPVTKDVEEIGSYSASSKIVNLPNYPMKLGFYKDGFWFKYLTVGFTNGWLNHPGRPYCYYTTQYYPYKLVNEHKGYDGPMKFHNFPTRVCNPLAKKLGI
ncbi:MAG: hypothetical protein RXR65_06810 [Hydrogenobaculum sp.]